MICCAIGYIIAIAIIPITVVGRTTVKNNPMKVPGSPATKSATLKKTIPETRIPTAVTAHIIMID